MARLPGRWTVVFAGGGTGGHLYPAIAVADEVRRRKPDADIVFIGTRGKIEARVVPKAGYAFVPIWISGFRRALSWSILLFPVKVVVALVQSFVVLRRLTPAVVVGTGGYVCGPPVFVASVLGIPTLIQEQNSFPGVTTRLLARRVDEVHVAFASSRRFLPADVAVKVTGNPVRSSMGSSSRAEGAALFGIRPEELTVLVFGGSLGASSINNAIRSNLLDLLAINVQILWQTGSADEDAMRSAVASLGAEAEKRIKVYAFIEKMEFAFAASDLAICRAGATTLAELALAGLPAVLIPYPHAAADHQRENARVMGEMGAAVVCDDAAAGRQVVPMIRDLLEHTERRNAMRERLKTLARPDAAAVLAEAIFHLGRGNVDGT